MTAETLTVATVDLSATILTFNASGSPPLSLRWCGDDAVSLLYAGASSAAAVLVGPFGDYKSFTYNSPLMSYRTDPSSLSILLASGESVRITRTPPSIAAVAGVGSVDPAAIVRSACQDFTAGDVNADAAAKTLTPSQLTAAVTTLLSAALSCPDAKDAKSLLSAASYGLTFLRDQRALAGKFRGEARTIRVLMTLRALGLDVCGGELHALGGIGWVVGVLEAMRKHKLLMEVVSYAECSLRLKLRAIEGMAKGMIGGVGGGAGVNETVQKIIGLLKEQGGGRFLPAQFARLSLHAWRAGEEGVAAALNHCEVDRVEQTYAFLDMGMLQHAAEAAARSRNAELLGEVLGKVEAKGGGARDQLIRSLIRDKLPAECLKMKRLEWLYSDRKSLMGLLLAAGMSADAGNVKVADAVRGWEGGGGGKGGAGEEDGAAHLTEAKKVLSIGSDNAAAFMRACVDEQLDLLTEQQQAAKMYGHALLKSEPGDSVVGLVKAIVHQAANDPREATKIFAHADSIARKFKMGEKRYQTAKVRALAETAQWPQLRLMLDGKGGKSVASTDIPAKAAIKWGASKTDQERLIEAVVDKEARYALWYSIEDWKNAARCAREMKDVDRMRECAALCGSKDRGIVEQIISS
ncbi:hypothetical protein TeGR_g12286 [Tetraparma gracilis]|uniref:Vacuolar protein sorting-associated protein 16 homolog n=1 Tax=Tetraparma gracilis TaxID=2962635 RepID=A0ABQ6M3Y9_9STRA|nr:hypothetical protein TeGR_g12286 [Tetraparma gracilis]